mmetsp:Transcript_2396/g.5543  ORF Transcript_2396/g.5543 Transcript_2396/m.5543 type:complete len:223 (-) Transcript_2396:459-1127(-)
MGLPPAWTLAPAFFASSTSSTTRLYCILLLMGPYWTPFWKPSPTFAFAASAASSLTNSSCMLSGTKARLMAMQTWPVFCMAPWKMPLAADFTSAPLSTMAGSLPPNSRVKRFSVPEVAAWIALPVRVLPVKLILAMSGCSVIKRPSASLPLTRLTTPGGNVSAKASESMSVVSGVYGEGFSTIVLPVMTASPSFHAAMSGGKFHGVMPPTTPRGTCFSITVS